MKKLTTRILAVLCFFLLILSCSEDEELKPTEIVLTPSSTLLVADGNDAVTFQVEVLDGSGNIVPNADYEIYVNGDMTASRTFKTTEIGQHRVVAAINNLESNEVVLNAMDPRDLPTSVTLTASSDFLIANGQDAVSFEVEVFNGNEELIEDSPYEVFINGELLTSETFSTTESGEYEVIAGIDELESQAILLNALHPDELAASIRLSASSNTLMADGSDEVTFDVEVLDEEEEVIETNNYEIYINNEKLESSSFSTSEKGEYRVVARMADIESNEIILHSLSPEDLVASLVLDSSVELIIADGTSSASLTVKAFDENDQEVPNVNFELLVQGSRQESSTFNTTKVGTYEITAKVNEITSNAINITARENKSYDEISIPVIFHIGHFGESVGSGSNVKAEQIEGLLEGLNKGFSNDDGSLNPNAVDTRIRFRLATLDRDNKTLAEPGINRIDISAFDIGSSSDQKAGRIMPVPFRSHCAASSAEGYKMAASAGDIPNDGELGQDETYELGKINSWPRADYLNIYVLPIQENLGMGGYAYFPFVSRANGFEGFNVLPEDMNVTFGKSEGAVIDTDVALYQQATTLVHEVGHNLSLYHNFSNDSCNTSDYCEDTYSYDRNAEAGSPHRDCPDNKVEVVHDNYMDYSGVYNTFTYEQRERMRHVFEYGYFYKDLKNSGK